MSEPVDLLNLLVAVLLAIVGWNVRQLVGRVDSMDAKLTRNTGRLIRIETKLGLSENGDDLA